MQTYVIGINNTKTSLRYNGQNNSRRYFMKLLKYALMFIFIASAMILSGCGGDKFEGTWYGITAKKDADVNVIQKIVIEKNGDNYIITPTDIFYYGNYTETRSEQNENPFYMYERYHTTHYYDAEIKLTTEQHDNYTAVAEKGKLGSFTYIEKDDTLVKDNLLFGGKFIYRKCDLKDLLPKLKEGTKNKYEKYVTNKEVADKNATHFMTFNGKGANYQHYHAYIESYHFVDDLPKELQW